MGRLFWILVTALVAACGPPPHHYRVDRSALVPVPVPDVASGPPGDSPEITISHSTVLWARAPEESPGSNVGLYVPRQQPGWMVRWRPRPAKPGALALDLRAGCEMGLESRSFRVVDNGMESPGPALVYWGGWAFSQRFENGAHWSWSTDVMISDIESRVRLTCLDCAGPGDDVTDGRIREGIAGARSQVALGVRMSALEVALIGAFRNQPYNVGTRDEALTDDEAARSTLTSGDVFPIAGAALGIHPHPRVALAGTVFWPFDVQGRSVRYGPIVGASLTVRAPKKKKKEE